MTSDIEAGSAVDQLAGRIHDENPYDYDFWEVLPRQIEAVAERFRDRIDKIKLVQNRAETGGVSEISELSDIVPLLFAHTAYKSYPEKWLFDRKWAMLGRWLDTVSTNRVLPIAGEIRGLDQWLERLEEQGHFMGTSSGTSGKVALMNNTRTDLDRSGKDIINILRWSGLKPNNDRLVISLGQTAVSARNMASGMPMIMAFGAPDRPPFSPDVPPITVGGILEMVLVRKQIAEGTAKPSDIARYEAETATRQESIEQSIAQSVEAIVANRDQPLHILAMYGPLYQVAERIRARGLSAKDFQPNTSFISGGLKRDVLPENYKEIIFDTLNLSDDRVCQSYSMQEVNTQSPRCPAGRYHLPPWMVLLLLDESGENLVGPVPTGEVEGRAGLFDVALEGRWGGVISGDKVKAQWEPCACGNRSPSLNAEIKRYADTEGGDKIACSGTIDAYVRGAAA